MKDIKRKGGFMISESVKERSVIFSGDEVRATQDGRKTQMRLVCTLEDINGTSFNEYGKEAMDALIRNKCPYGIPGDRLWVKETWGVQGYGSTAKFAHTMPELKSRLQYHASYGEKHIPWSLF